MPLHKDNIYYNNLAIATIRANTFRRYRSNWRVLHVDGFESEYFHRWFRGPLTMGRQIKFFTYPSAEEVISSPPGFVQGEV